MRFFSGLLIINFQLPLKLIAEMTSCAVNDLPLSSWWLLAEAWQHPLLRLHSPWSPWSTTARHSATWILKNNSSITALCSHTMLGRSRWRRFSLYFALIIFSGGWIRNVAWCREKLATMTMDCAPPSQKCLILVTQDHNQLLLVLLPVRLITTLAWKTTHWIFSFLSATLLKFVES